MSEPSTSQEKGERHGRKVALAAIFGGILLALGGSYLILSSSGLGPSTGNQGAGSDAPLQISADGRIDLSSANRSCTTNADCEFFSPFACPTCTCEWAVVSRSESDRLHAAYDLSKCPAPPEGAPPECKPCPLPEAGCLDGVCTQM